MAVLKQQYLRTPSRLSLAVLLPICLGACVVQQPIARSPMPRANVSAGTESAASAPFIPSRATSEIRRASYESTESPDATPISIVVTEEENAVFRAEAAEKQRQREAAEVEEFGRVLNDSERDEIREHGRILTTEERVEFERIAAAQSSEREARRLRRRELQLEKQRLESETALEAERLAIERERIEQQDEIIFYYGAGVAPPHRRPGGRKPAKRPGGGLVIDLRGDDSGAEYGSDSRRNPPGFATDRGDDAETFATGRD